MKTTICSKILSFFSIISKTDNKLIMATLVFGVSLLTFAAVSTRLDQRFSFPQVNYEMSSFQDFGKELIWLILGGFIGALIALWLDKFRLPDIEITCPEDIHNDNKYDEQVPRPFNRAKFFRVKVINKALPKWTSFFINRVAAEQVSAKIYIKEIDKTMKGRWASTLELAFASAENILRLAQFPETETIPPGGYVPLDVFIKPEGMEEAYGWNNEAYLYKWQTPHYEMKPGSYTIIVTVTMSNGQTKTVSFEALIDKTIDGTYIQHKKEELK